MTLNDRAALCAQLMRHEGVRLKPYTDTVGKLTIGCGRNLTDRGISEDEAHYLLENDVDACIRDLSRLAWFADLDPVRQRALVDLCFNVGMAALLGFQHALAAMAIGDYPAAADGFTASRWYQQVGVRGPAIVAMVRTGQEPA